MTELRLGFDGSDVARTAEIPAFARIAELISAEIRRGRLRPGARLPGSRSLAEQLGVGRNTVVAAYAELVSEGWLVTRAAGGSFVSDELPEPKTRRFGTRGAAPAKQAPGFAFEPRALERTYDDPPGMLALHGGTPDLREFPATAWARAYRRALGQKQHGNLSYAAPFGQPRLREALGQLVSATRGLAASPDQILVTRGSQMALDLLARTLVRPGDRVAVEEIGYQHAWRALRAAGAELVFIPVDRHGLNVEALAAEVARAPIRALYVSPHHQYPTTVALPVARRLRLLELAEKQRFAVLEDDYDHEFHYDGRPLASLAGADRAGVVVYVGTLAKVLAPGLRLGFIAAPRTLIDTLAAVRADIDRQGDGVLECAVAELIEDGELGRHTRRMKRIYHARRDAFAELLITHLGDAVKFELPAGGMSLWAEARRGVHVERWLERARALGVTFTTGKSYFDPHGAGARAREYARSVRFGFAPYAEKELELAVKRLARALT